MRSFLCRDCARDERYGQAVDDHDPEKSGQSETEKIATYACAHEDCEYVFEQPASDRRQCPECGYYGLRCLDIEERVIT